MERRTFLVLTASAAGLAGCTPDPEPAPRPTVAPTTASPSDPDERLRARVAAGELGLIAAYRSALESNPGLSGELEPLMADHVAHLERVAPGTSAVPEPSASASSSSGSGAAEPSAATPNASASVAAEPSASGSTTGAPTDTSTAAPPSRSRRKTLTGLADAESLALTERTSACDSAQSPALARDLCLIAASEAQHAQALLDLKAGPAG
ncbi:MAG: hypothetical protein OEU98_03450 [Actinomycetota bacterium]|nr:hypothetical protein [Actinomycetota bacterium]